VRLDDYGRRRAEGRQGRRLRARTEGLRAGQASASILARNILGATPGELRELREKMRKMLKENGPAPDGKWADLAVLEPVRDYKARHASTLLPFDAVVDALKKIEAAPLV